MIQLKNKKKLFAIGAVALVAVVGGTIAVNSSIFTFDNDFKLGYYSTQFTETFDSPNDWEPCDTTAKSVVVKNDGVVPALARIKMEESWVASDNETQLSLVKDGITLASANFSNNNWVKNNEDGYYYYNATLQPGDTAAFLDSVTLNCNANFGENIMVDGEGNSTTTGEDYSGAVYHLKITIQMMQADVTGASWQDAFGALVQPIIGRRA